jgi:rRNA maturation protein Rpf1
VYKKARELGSDHILIIDRWKGGPGRLRLHVTPFIPDTPTILDLHGVRTQREIGRKTVVKRDLAVTVANNVSMQVRHFAYLFSQFLGVQLLDNPQFTSCEASAHFSSIRERDLKIAFTMPPMKTEIGPTLTVRLHYQSSMERFP